MKTALPHGSIHLFERDDLQWPFHDGPNGGPSLTTLRRRAYANEIKVDPFPCYSHDLEYVTELVEKVEAAFPIGFQTAWYLLPCESGSRTNGYAQRDWVYKDGESREWDPLIVLSGKRIPIHPAMTRYLVAHEYGHVVQWWIEHQRDIKDEHPLTQFDREYAELRGIEPNGGYGGLRWHANIGELIANDFRICVAKAEVEFWPHPGFEHPKNLPAVKRFWKRMVREHAHAC